MGFTSGFYKVKKLIPNLTKNNIETINHYYSYNNNDWAKENFSTWQDYVKYMSDSNTDLSQVIIDMYKNEVGENNLIDTEIFSWYSTGRYFHDYVKSINHEFLSKEDCCNILKYANEQCNEIKFKPVSAKRTFRIDRSNLDRDIEDCDIISTNCDGIEIEDIDRNMKRIYTDDIECSELFICAGRYFDEDEYYAFSTLRDTMINIISDTDFDNEVVYYEGGW